MIAVIRSAVDSGEYSSASEVIREALRGWKIKRKVEALELENFAALSKRESTVAPPSTLKLSSLAFEKNSRTESGRRVMRLVFSPRAALDLEEIGDYIARDNPRRAISFLGELEAHCHKIAEMPSAFPKREDLSPDLRMQYTGITSSCFEYKRIRCV